MKRRQTLPRQWLVADERLDKELWRAVQMLPRGSGVLFLYRHLPIGERARMRSRLRHLGRWRGLSIIGEAPGQAARVHNAKELRQAALGRIPVLFLSPMFPTRSHPDWKPIPRMRAAALLRLARVPVIALGGMDERRFRRLKHLRFHGWAGIDAWIRT